MTIWLVDAPFIDVMRVILCTTDSSTVERWLRAPRLPVVHACRDPRLPVHFSALLSDPFPTVVLVSNGLGHRSPQTRKNSIDSFVVLLRRNLGGPARTTDRSAIISRAWPSH